MPDRYDPPDTPQAWRAKANKYGLDAMSIYDLGNLKSASKFDEKEFLALRVIWITRGANKFNSKAWGLDVKGAQEHLEKLPSWQAYINQLQTGLGDKPLFGRFDLVWDFQKQIRDTVHPRDGPSKIRWSPINRRCRDPSKRPQYAEPQTPTPANRGPTFLAKFKALETGDADEPYPTTRLSRLLISPRSPDSGENNDEFSQADDEQTVNMALVLFIIAVCLDMPLLSAAWTLERKIFIFMTVDDLSKIYEARTDGHLRLGKGPGGKSLAILEVKANPFKKSQPEKQQSAQMAAWIRSEPDEPTQDGQYRRLMISQTCDEIFLIIAQYDNNYIKYLTNGDFSDDPFLKMCQFGPFVATGSNHMRVLGAYIYAFTSRLVASANDGKPFRW